MKTISEIYEEYKIMPNLQLHMLRVASVASQICDGMDIQVDKERIIKACLFHDMGNIIKSNLDHFPQWNEPKGKEYWQQVKDEYIAKYGTNEHKATLQIMKELGIAENVIELVDNVGHYLFCDQLQSDDFNKKITNYADVRPGLYGVIPYDERMKDVYVRYKNSPIFVEEKHNRSVMCGKEIERQIFLECKIKPEDITDESVAPIMEELKNFVVIE